MMKITHPCAVNAQPGKGFILLSTSEYNRKRSVNELSVTRHKGDGNDNNDDDDDVSNHLKCKHTLIYT
jgi:hypothetical protein